MSPLESLIVAEAQGYLTLVVMHYLMVREGTVDEHDQPEFEKAKGGLMSLVALAHRADSGMSEEAVQALLEIERKEASAAASGADVPAPQPRK